MALLTASWHCGNPAKRVPDGAPTSDDDRSSHGGEVPFYFAVNGALEAHE